MFRKNRSFVLIMVILSFMCNFGAAAWPKESIPDDEARVIFTLAEGERVTLKVEIADTPAELQQGLMFRRHLEADRGMLFIFPYASRQKMWMMNTFIPLDMIFINDMMRIVGVVENTEPLSTTVLEVPAPSRYVVEVNAFFCRRFGIQPGDKVIIQGIRVNP